MNIIVHDFNQDYEINLNRDCLKGACIIIFNSDPEFLLNSDIYFGTLKYRVKYSSNILIAFPKSMYLSDLKVYNLHRKYTWWEWIFGYNFIKSKNSMFFIKLNGIWIGAYDLESKDFSNQILNIIGDFDTFIFVCPKINPVEVERRYYKIDGLLITKNVDTFKN